MHVMIHDGDMYGLAFHVHHRELVQPLTGWKQRVNYIRSRKPIVERETRLRLLNIIPLEDEFGVTQAPGALIKLVDDWLRAVRRDEYWGIELAELVDWVGAHPAEMDDLHNKLCLPDCSWDGRTIFPNNPEWGH